VQDAHDAKEEDVTDVTARQRFSLIGKFARWGISGTKKIAVLIKTDGVFYNIIEFIIKQINKGENYVR
jgi:hypothetical protein